MGQVSADILISAAELERIKANAEQAGMTLNEFCERSAEKYSSELEQAAQVEQRSMRAHCEGCGYTHYIAYPSGRDACIARFAYTYAILADMTPGGYGDRWCYATFEQARAALKVWDGGHDTEPERWHRHPTTGRRRPDGDAAREYTAI